VKFTADIKDLKRAVAYVKRALPPKNALFGVPGIQMHVEGGQVRLAVRGEELSLETTLDGGETDGEAVVPGRRFAQVLTVANGHIVVTHEDKEIVVKDEVGAWRMEEQCRPEEFPARPESPKRLAALAPEFASAVAQVVPAAGRDLARPILAAVLLEGEQDGMRLVATDSFRLALRDIDGTAPKEPVLVPASALALLRKERSVSFGVRDGWATFKTEAGVVSARLVVGEFPKYRPLIPETTTSAVIERASLLAALDRTRPFQDETTPVRLELKKRSVVSIESHLGSTVASLQADVIVPPPRIAFNPSFLRAGAVPCGDDIEVAISDPLKPALLRSGDFHYLLMPVRLS
jgi:DNA polymerase-3 subunit beta